MWERGERVSEKLEREREREIEKHTQKNLWIKPERNVAKPFQP
jgi:hypothetical protein